MPRRINRAWDPERTEQLALDELYVRKGKGDENHFFAWLQEPEVEECPLCGGNALKVQDLFTKTYRDRICFGGRERAITLVYEFYKYRCLDPRCRHIFAKEIRFASPSGNVTFRFEEEIARLVMQGFSYGEIAGRFPKAVSRAGIGQIFRRWVQRKEEARRFQGPVTTLGLFSGRTDRERYTLFLSLDGGIRVLDVQYGVDSQKIAAKLQEIGLAEVQTVLSDCDPTISDIVDDYFPESTYIVPAECWFRLVTEDFREYAAVHLRWRQEANKLELILQSEEELGYRVAARDELLESRPTLRQPYLDYHELRRLLLGHGRSWTFAELSRWVSTACEELREAMKGTFLQFEACREAIRQHELRRDLVPDNLYRLTRTLEELLSGSRTFSEEQLKARVLYSVPADAEHWQGVALDEVIRAWNGTERIKTGGERYGTQ